MESNALKKDKAGMHTSFLSRHFVFIQLLAAALMAHTATHGQSLTVKGTWDPGFPDQAAFVRLVGTNAVIASRWERLKMADVSDPQRPRIVGDVQVTSQTDPYHRIAALAVDGEGHAFLAGTDTHFVGRFYVYDISSPADPKLIGKRDIVPTFPDDNFGMAVSPGRAYLAAN